MGIPHNNPASGVVDGVNRRFRPQVQVAPGVYTPVPYTPNTTAVFWNGKVTTGEHVEVGPGYTEVELTTAPLPGHPLEPLDEGDQIRIWFLDTTPDDRIVEYLVDIEVTLEDEEQQLAVTVDDDPGLGVELEADELQLGVDQRDDEPVAIELADDEVTLTVQTCIEPS